MFGLDLFHSIKQSLAPPPTTLQVDGRNYAVTQTENGPELGALIAPPLNETLMLSSLTGFVDAFTAGLTGTVHVVDYRTVQAVTLNADQYGRRQVLLKAVNAEANPFPFDEYQVPEQFLIKLQSGFLPTDNTVALQRLASSLSAGQSINTQDDGFSQKVVVNQGAVQAAEVSIPPRLPLLAYRTFREIAPVQSDFLIRLKGKSGELPQIALLQVDAGKWKHDTQLMVKNWLVNKLPAGTVVIA